MNWFVYIIECSDGALYTGVSTDVARRFRQHAETKQGARFFRGRIPLKVVYVESGHSRSSACKREAAIKRGSRDSKLHLIAEANAAAVSAAP